MRATTLLVLGCCAAASIDVEARTFVVPHIIDSTGRIHSGPIGTFGPLTTTPEGDSIGPGENGEFNVFYPPGGTIRWSFADSLGRTADIDFNILFAQSRPEGNLYRCEMFIDPVWATLNGEPVNAHAAGLELSILSSTPDPWGVTELVFPMPAREFVAEDGSGRRISIDMDAGDLRIVPSPMSMALLALAGLFRGRSRK